MNSKIPARLTLNEGSLATFEAPTATDSKRRFEMVAYTGGEMIASLPGVSDKAKRVVVDLAGMSIKGNRKPILRQHDSDRIAGYSDKITKGNTLVLSGTLSARSGAGREVAELADEGFPWQASMGIGIEAVEYVKAGDSVTVNGAEFAGPGIVVRESTYKESSFVPLGADGDTSGVVFSDDGNFIDLNIQENSDMTLEQFTTFAAANPDATKAFIDQGYDKAKAELAPKPATATELTSAFPEHKGFCMDQMVANATLTEATAAFAKLATDEAAQLKAQVAELTAKLTKASEGQGPVGTFAAATEPEPKLGDKPDGDREEVAAWAKLKAEAEFADKDARAAAFISRNNKVGYVALRVAQETGVLKSPSTKPIESK